MCDVKDLEFFIENAKLEEFAGKRVLEVGSRYVNGSVRPFIERFLHPMEYIGIDIEPGRYVDLVLPAGKLLEYFGRNKFDVVISTATLEHIVDWREAITNMKDALKPGGYIYITTVSRGFPYHAYPFDFWRYEVNDMKKIFRDFEIIILKKHETYVFLKARKPENYVPADLSNIALYSILLGRRTRDIPNISDAPLIRRLMLRLHSSKARRLLSILVNRFLR